MLPFRRAWQVLCVLPVLVLAACGGGSSAPSGTPVQVQQQQGITIGEPNPSGLDVTPFVTMARAERCAGTRNNLYVIDNAQVFWDRAGPCPDNAHYQALYGAKVDTVLCWQGDFIAPPSVKCNDESFRAEFSTILANLDKPDLGLGSGHTVKAVDLGLKGAVGANFDVILSDNQSAVKDAQNDVLRDATLFNKMWAAHYSGTNIAPVAPAIDFNKQMVLALFAGWRDSGCRSLSVVKVINNGARIEVDYEMHDLMTFAPCSGAQTAPATMVTMDRSDLPVDFVDMSKQAVAFKVLDASMQGGIATSQNLVVRDAAAWDKLWSAYKPGTATPQVDFSRNMVIGVFLGPSDACHNIAVGSITDVGGSLVVNRVVTVPPVGMMCIMLATAPAQLVVVPRSDGDVSFTEQINTSPL